MAYRNFKMSKARTAEYLENKKLVNDYFNKIKRELIKLNIRFDEASFGRQNTNNVNSSTTIYINGKYRVSTHKKKNEHYSMENGILITMRNVKANDLQKDINKILEYIK